MMPEVFFIASTIFNMAIILIVWKERDRARAACYNLDLQLRCARQKIEFLEHLIAQQAAKPTNIEEAPDA